MNELDSAIYAVWQAYYGKVKEIYPRANSGEGPFAATKKQRRELSAFTNIAKWCLANKVTATDFIAVTFPYVRMQSRTMLPRDFHKEETFKYYLRHKRDSVCANPEQEWLLQETTLLGVCRRCGYQDYVPALKVITMPFSFWFRVLYAEPFSEELFNLYGELAWTELRQPQQQELRAFLRTKRGGGMQELERRIASFSDGF